MTFLITDIRDHYQNFNCVFKMILLRLEIYSKFNHVLKILLVFNVDVLLAKYEP